MRPITSDHFPIAGMDVLFTLKEDKNRIIHTGKYTFNKECARRFMDEYQNEYTSNQIDEWDEYNKHDFITEKYSLQKESEDKK